MMDTYKITILYKAKGASKKWISILKEAENPSEALAKALAWLYEDYRKGIKFVFVKAEVEGISY